MQGSAVSRLEEIWTGSECGMPTTVLLPSGVCLRNDVEVMFTNITKICFSPPSEDSPNVVYRYP